jgi:hypothetical protein
VAPKVALCPVDHVAYCTGCSEEIGPNEAQAHHCTIPIPMGQMDLFTPRLDFAYLGRPIDTLAEERDRERMARYLKYALPIIRPAYPPILIPLS